jgi:hypothetical protein
MCSKGEFDVEIGEGFWMEGKRAGDSIDLKIAFEVGGNTGVPRKAFALRFGYTGVLGF